MKARAKRTIRLSRLVASVMTYEEKREKLREALPAPCWLVDFGDDFLIYEGSEGKYYRMSYSVMDEKITFGDKTEVEKQISYEPVKMNAALSLSSAAGDSSSEDYGYKWRVRVVNFGVDINGTDWVKTPMLAALDKFEGAKVFMLTEAQHQEKPGRFGKPPTAIVGWLSGVKADDTGISADFNILKSAKHLRDALVDSFERGNPDLLGLSLDVRGVTEKGTKGPRLKAVKSVSVDVVYEPAAGGKFEHIAAAQTGGGGNKEDEMKYKRLLAALRKRAEARKDARMLAAIGEVEAKGDDVTDADIDKLSAAMEEEEDIDVSGTQGAKASGKGDSADAHVLACGILLKSELKDSGLPDVSQKIIEKQFAGKTFSLETLIATIKDKKDELDALKGAGVTGVGDVRVTESDLEARAKMFDDFFDSKVHSFKACYVHLTGDSSVTGRLDSASRLRGSVDSATFAQILGDSIRRRMIVDYKEPSDWDNWRKIVSISPLSDFRTQHRTRMGGYGDLPTVLEGDPYTALSTPSDEEATYSASKRGGTEDITMEAIKNDDAGLIRRIPMKLSRAAKRTLYKFVFDFLKTNPTIYDTVALFHANHSNLGSAALDATSLSARRHAMLKQTEADSSEVLGIPAKYLVVPIALDKTGFDLITPANGSYMPTSPDYIKTQNMELIVVSYWTDDTDWCLTADPNDLPCIEVGFVDGNEMPEIYVQDMPNVGSMFTNDKLTWKLRHAYGGAVTDYRGLDKSVVAG